jgi:hypothetical protein
MNNYRKSKYFEILLAERYSKEWREPSFVPVGRFSDFDFCSQSKKFSVEVKLERSSIRTGNIAIEYWNTSLDEPSGILSTKAKTWVHCIEYDYEILCLEFDTKVLLKMVIEEGKLNHIENAKFKCLSVEKVRPYAKREFVLSRAEYSLALDES